MDRGASALTQSISQHPIGALFLFLLPAVFLLAPLPIDETRYLAVAWEMRQTGEFLVPHLNGDLYAQKPPLLFWLINAGWLVTGVHGWTARLMSLLCAALSLLLIRRIALRLDDTSATASTSMWTLAGIVYVALFANGIMFDVLLMACALIAVLGVIDIAQEHRERGVAVLAVGIGLGILAKGPVVLLDVGLVAMLAPWWSERVRAAPWRYYGTIVLGILFGALIGLAWAIPAAVHGGDEYANTILFKQTFDRVSKSFAHRQPFWWYVVILPPMLLPWLIVLRGRWSAIKPLIELPLVRFALAWVVPSVIAFSMVSGKQGHYLLPILPGFALLFAAALAHRAVRVRMGLLGLAVIAIGIVFVVLPYIATSRPHWNLLIPLWPLWGLMTVAFGIAIIVWRKRLEHPCFPALVSLAIVMLFRLAIAQGPGHAYDPTPIAERIRAAQLRHQPIIHIGWHHGVFEFAGRLTEPLATLPLADLAGWVARNPDGLVVSFEPRFRFKATPLFDQPFRGARASIWNAHDALESGVVPKTDSTPDDSDLSPDED